MRRILSYFLICCVALSISSCTITKALWGRSGYDETIRQFFVSADGRYIVLIGTSYHYVLTDGSNALKTVMSLKQRESLKMDETKTELEIDKNNDIRGSFVLEGPFSMLTPEDMASLRAIGMTPDRYDNVSITIKISGRRYLPRYLGNGISNLTSPYKIRVFYNNSNIAKSVGKAAVTPIAVGLDAVLMVGKVILFPLTSN